MTKTVTVGTLPLGGGHPVLVQSMTNTDTRDVPATLAQIRALDRGEAGRYFNIDYQRMGGFFTTLNE